MAVARMNKADALSLAAVAAETGAEPEHAHVVHAEAAQAHNLAAGRAECKGDKVVYAHHFAKMNEHTARSGEVWKMHWHYVAGKIERKVRP